MPNPLLTEALKEAYATASPRDEVIDTLEIISTAGTLYVCSGLVSRTLTVPGDGPQTFQPLPLSFSLPPLDNTGGRFLTIGIENVDGQVIQFLTDARDNGGEITVLYRTYLSSDDTAPQSPRPITMNVTNAKNTLKGVVLTAALADIVNRSFPNAHYTYTRFPGLR